MARYYYIGPWVWRTDPEMGQCWDAPAGTVGRIDLRPLAACAQAGGSHPQNYGLFVTESPLLDAKYTLLATDLDAGLKALGPPGARFCGPWPTAIEACS